MSDAPENEEQPEEMNPENSVDAEIGDEVDSDPLERAEKEGGDLAEFDLEAQIEEFRAQVEEEPDQCVHHYNLAEALEELGEHQESREEYEKALALDENGEFHSIIHFGLGNLIFNQVLSGIQSVVVKSSVGLHSAHKPGDSITDVFDEDYMVPIENFEKSIQTLPQLKADDDLVDYIAKNAPAQLASVYYKWASDLIDKSRQISHYGDEVKDVKRAIKLLRKALDIDTNHSQASMMVNYAKKMIAEGWKAYDEYGFEAKNIEGEG